MKVVLMRQRASILGGNNYGVNKNLQSEQVEDGW